MKNELIRKLSQGVADTQVLWNKIHNLHWNIQGPSFQQIHGFTESIYDEMAEQFDALAERILMLGAKPPVTLAACLKMSAIQETDANVFSAEEVLGYLEKDLTLLLSNYREARNLAATENDAATDSMLTGMIEGLEKTLWMIRSSR